MKFLSVFIGLIIIVSISLGQTIWTTQNSGTNKFLTDVFFIDENNGWITGWTGTILHTTDGGANWVDQGAPPTNAYEGVHFVDNLNGIIQMKGIEMKRNHFSVISDKLYIALESFGNTGDQPRYYQYCPMAFDDKGAYWISDTKAIRNPYFGDMMLKCGETKKEFNN